MAKIKRAKVYNVKIKLGENSPIYGNHDYAIYAIAMHGFCNRGIAIVTICLLG